MLAVALLATGCDTGSDPGAIEARGGDVRLVVVPPVPVSGTIPDHVLVNDSDEDVGYGHPYNLERRTGDGWRHVENPCAFTLEGLHLAPGEQSPPESVGDCREDAPGLESGVYRLTKDVDFEAGVDEWRTETLEVTFTVI